MTFSCFVIILSHLFNTAKMLYTHLTDVFMCKYLFLYHHWVEVSERYLSIKLKQLILPFKGRYYSKRKKWLKWCEITVILKNIDILQRNDYFNHIYTFWRQDSIKWDTSYKEGHLKQVSCKNAANIYRGSTQESY